MKRVKRGKTFYLLPGGWLEDWESLEEGLIREFKEETSLDILEYEKVWVLDQKATKDAHIFWIKKYTWTVKLWGEELEFNCADNKFELVWIDVDKLDTIIMRSKWYLKLIRSVM
jgi:ADP-ribose pyrophosphatase YjhB (NUDIX family)